ncbi:Alpha-ketoglutarate-dependent dioxygenase alkB 2 [Balamuthia mandrillaris]
MQLINPEHAGHVLSYFRPPPSPSSLRSSVFIIFKCCEITSEKEEPKVVFQRMAASITTFLDGLTSAHGLGAGDSFYLANFLPQGEQPEWFARLQDEIEFLPRHVLTFRIYGRTMQLPRDKQFFGDLIKLSNNNSHNDSDKKKKEKKKKKKNKKDDGEKEEKEEEQYYHPLYRYGGDYYPPVHSWTPGLARLRDKVLKKTGQRCNHCVVNRYLNGNDHIGLHRDKVRDFVEDSCVMTVSLGAARLFRLKQDRPLGKEEEDQGLKQVDIILQPGSLFCLGPKTNATFKHSIVKRSVAEVPDTRISITLRSIKTMYMPDKEGEKGRIFESESELLRSVNKGKRVEEERTNKEKKVEECEEEEEEEEEKHKTKGESKQNKDAKRKWNKDKEQAKSKASATVKSEKKKRRKEAV